MPRKSNTPTINPFNNGLKSLQTNHSNTLFPACQNPNINQQITLPTAVINGNTNTPLKSKLCVP